jgi:hypothetical protein
MAFHYNIVGKFGIYAVNVISDFTGLSRSLEPIVAG